MLISNIISQCDIEENNEQGIYTGGDGRLWITESTLVVIELVFSGG